MWMMGDHFGSMQWVHQRDGRILCILRSCITITPPKRLRFKGELFDGTRSLNAYIDEKEVEIRQGTTREKVIEAELEEEEFSPNQINEKFKNRET